MKSIKFKTKLGDFVFVDVTSTADGQSGVEDYGSYHYTVKDTTEAQAAEIVEQSICTGMLAHYVGITNTVNVYCYKRATD